MSLLTYSGITTKVRAMESRLFTEEQFREMAALEDVHSAADYLKQQPAYAGIFSGLDDSMLHRGNIERLLTLSLYRDFASLYRFGSLKQRRFLDLYFMHYEIDIMKRALRHVYSKQPAEMDLSEFREFFEKHSLIDLVALSQSESLEEFLSSLKGSIYYDLLAGLAENGKCSSFDYELQLDLFYFKSLWKIKNKILSKKELKILDECFGSKIDLLNIQWMYRSTQYYHLPAADIYSLLIPIRYRLKPEQINRMDPQEKNFWRQPVRPFTEIWPIPFFRKIRMPMGSTAKSWRGFTVRQEEKIPILLPFSIPIFSLRNGKCTESLPFWRESAMG